MSTRGRTYAVVTMVLELALSNPAQAGDIVGSVKLVGEAPPLEPRRASADHAVCGSEPRPSDALIVSAGGGVKNAVVFIAHERLGGDSLAASPEELPIRARRP